MNKTAIKNFAIAARLTLIDAVTQRAYEYEVTENGKNNPDQTEASGQALTPTELSQRRQLIERIRLNGFAQTMEEAACLMSGMTGSEILNCTARNSVLI